MFSLVNKLFFKSHIKFSVSQALTVSGVTNHRYWLLAPSKKGISHVSEIYISINELITNIEIRVIGCDVNVATSS